ncbi:hypothetical protein LP421_31940 (plasmid) [Rhizobium sp. RCAM05350]|nr:hypothetical protein LP421_31940 [Rhizobium sp. RCAM05350]
MPPLERSGAQCNSSAGSTPCLSPCAIAWSRNCALKRLQLYLELIRLKLVDGGYLSLGQKGWKSVIGAMMTYCRDRGVRKVCAEGPFAPRTTAALQALF